MPTEPPPPLFCRLTFVDGSTRDVPCRPIPNPPLVQAVRTAEFQGSLYRLHLFGYEEIQRVG